MSKIIEKDKQLADAWVSDRDLQHFEADDRESLYVLLGVARALERARLIEALRAVRLSKVDDENMRALADLVIEAMERGTAP